MYVYLHINIMCLTCICSIIPAMDCLVPYAFWQRVCIHSLESLCKMDGWDVISLLNSLLSVFIFKKVHSSLPLPLNRQDVYATVEVCEQSFSFFLILKAF